MTAASRSLATALSRARFASRLLQPSYTTNRDTTQARLNCGRPRFLFEVLACDWVMVVWLFMSLDALRPLRP